MSAKLTPLEKRIIIAETMWKLKGCSHWVRKHHDYSDDCIDCMPDYLGSRDAMAEAIRKGIKDIWMHDFIMYLIDKTHKQHGNLSHESTLALIVAKPEQLADAYLLTLGLATEEQL